MNLYRYSLSDIVSPTSDFSINVSAGIQDYTFRFIWPTFLQEQIDKVEQRVEGCAATDPIIEGDSYNRTYDWIGYYKDIDPSAAGIQEWYEAQEYLPQSLVGKSSSVYTALIQARIQEANEYFTELEIKYESLRWMIEASTAEGETIVTNLQLGGWIDYTTGHAFRFVSEGRDVIGYNDLKYVTMEFDIDE